MPKSRATVCRSAECTGGCGRTIHRCRLPDPVCRECRKAGRTLVGTADAVAGTVWTRRAVEILRRRQVVRYMESVRRVMTAVVRRWADARGCRPSRRQRRRIERRVLRCLAARGIPTCYSLLPRPGSAEWRAMSAVLDQVVAGVCRRTAVEK